MHSVKVGRHTIGPGSPPFFVAELGICHEGRLDIALELTEKAAIAGAHIVKTETFQREMLVFSPDAMASYTINGEKITFSLSELMDRYELSYDEHHQIKLKCDELHVPFMSTAHDFNGIDFLKEIGAAAIKIASPDIINYPLLRYAASAELPIFLDTGSAYQHEVELAVKTIRDQGWMDIIVNHNPNGHPAAPAGHNLRTIKQLEQILQLPVGLSDHYEGYEMLYAAVAAGALTVEKPVSRDRTVLEPERNWSISIDDLQQVITTTMNVYEALGSPQRQLTRNQEEYRNNNRLACVVGRDLAPGDQISLEHIIFGRPRKGIGVEHWDLIEGRILRKEKKKNSFLQWSDLG